MSMDTAPNRLAQFLAINRTVGIVLLTVLLFGLGEQLWHPFLPLFLKSQTKEFTAEVADTGTLSNVALWSIGIYACLLNLFQGFCYIGGGQITARLGDRGSLMFFGMLTIAGYLLFLLVPLPWATVLACLLILGWESLSMPVTFTTVGGTLEKERHGMAFAVQSIQKRLPKILGPACIALVMYYLAQHYSKDDARLVAMPYLVGTALALGVASLFVQWRFMPHRPAPKIEGNTWSVLAQFPTNVRRLLLAEILTRWCDWLVRELVVVYLAVERGLDDSTIFLLVTLQHVVALLTYLPIGRMTTAVGLQPFIGLTFVFFALFPLVLILVPNEWMWFAYVIYGLREIGEPARKAMITMSLPEPIRARGVGLYWGVRGFAICTSALVGAWLWQWGGPRLLFVTAFAMGALGVLVYYLFFSLTPAPLSNTVEPETR
jgi:MFS family permease